MRYTDFMSKKRTLPTRVILIVVLSWVLGFVSASYFGWALRKEQYRIDPSSVEVCPEASASVCETIPKYNPNASGGYTGFPLRSARYYCVNDARCAVVSESYLFISLRTINWLIWSAFYTLVLYGGFAVYKRQRAK